MRTLSSPTSTAVAKTITQPGYLVELDFSTVQRFSSRGDVSWNSFTWLNNNVVVGQLQEAPNGSVQLALAIGNADLAFGAVCLNEAPQEKTVTVWAFYEGATASGDPVQIFSGVIDGCDISEAMVNLQLRDLNSRTLFIPRRRATPATGFNHLLPSGRVIQFGGVRYEITGQR
jgi:hypothetical protein